MARFKPVLVQQQNLNQLPIVDGQLICVFDTGKAFVDYQGQRRQIAGGNPIQDLNRVIVSQSMTVQAGNWYICAQPVTITLPQVHQQLDLVKVSTAIGVKNVSIVPAAGQSIQSESSFDLGIDLVGVQFIWDTNKWKIAQLTSRQSRDIKLDLYDVKSQDVTKFQVYATDQPIAAGTIDSDTGLAYAVAVPAGMTHTFKLRSDTPQENQDVIVSWGDGTVSSLKNGDYTSLDDSEFAENGELIYLVSHTYTVPGKYIITVAGNGYWGFQTKGDDANTPSILSRVFAADLPVASCVTNLSLAARGSLKLQSVLIPTGMDFFSNIHNASVMFSQCKNLISATNFATKFQFTRYVQQMFFDCQNMVECDFRIPPNCLKEIGSRQVFYNCKKLTAKVQDLLPQRGFYGRSLNLMDCFRGCSSLTGTVPASILWNDPRIVWSSTNNVFTGCSPQIRAQVPVSWGGTGAQVDDPHPVSIGQIGSIVTSKVDQALQGISISTGGSTGIGNVLGGYAAKIIAYQTTTSNNSTTYTLHLAPQSDQIDWANFQVGKSVRISVPDASADKLLFAQIATVDSTNSKITLVEALNVPSGTQLGMQKRTVSGYTGSATGGLTAYRVTYSGAGTDPQLCQGRQVYTRAGTGAFKKNSIQGTLGNYIFLSSAAVSGTNALYFPPSNAILSVTSDGSDSDVCFATGQFNTVIGQAASAQGAFNAVSGAGTSAIGMTNTIFGDISIAAGTNNVITGQSVYTFGISNVIADSLNIVIGDGNKVYRQGAKILGDMNIVAAVHTYAIGTNNKLKEYGVMALGTNNQLSGKYAVSIGYSNKVAAQSAYVLGRYANVHLAAQNKNAFIVWGGQYQNNAQAFSVRVFRSQLNPLYNGNSLAPGYTGTQQNPKDSSGQRKYNSVPGYCTTYKGQLKPKTQVVNISGQYSVMLDPTMFSRVSLIGSGTATLELPDYVQDGDSIQLVVDTASVSIVIDANWHGHSDALASNPGLYILQIFCVRGQIYYKTLFPYIEPSASERASGFIKYVVQSDIAAVSGAWYLCTDDLQVTLPAVHSVGDIVKVSTIQNADQVSIVAVGADTIQMDTVFLLDTKNSSVQFLWDGSQWIIAQVVAN